ncbi:hypothetical protein OS493_014603 [Desmophyllum pertusum]|uniref:CxC5 like cysteine cluster associated with KDZ domain-containing protein n=1 Tax=Desmophyllum pertusum TaxID=174260 RepID=A0A9W9YPT1_9CNID|nr:hypothetical protein OS493_014603 [Desmophyllum pertusum]
MPPKGRKWTRVYAASLVKELCREVDSSVAAEDALVGAFRVMCSTKLTLDGVRNLPPKVISAHLSAKYEGEVISYVSFFLEDLRVLPVSVRLATISKLTGVSAEEASLLFEGLEIVNKSLPVRNGMDLAGLSGALLLSPPTATCLLCSSPLALHNKRCDVTVHSLRGKAVGLKFSLRCEHCRINYNYDRYGDNTRGWSLYTECRPFVEASDVCFIERKLLDFQCALANHSWVSFSGFSTAYNEAFGLLAGEEDYGEKQAASSFWNGELEAELRELEKLDFFGLMKKNEDREKVMEKVDKVRAKSVYSHSPADCSDSCKARGCGRLWVVDGQWKLMFAHCMMQRKVHH